MILLNICLILMELGNSFSLLFFSSLHISQLAQENYGNRLVDGFPYLEAEVFYVAQEEMAETAVDVISRRLRLAFLDAEASERCASRVIELMTLARNWDEERVKKEKEELKYYLHIMNVGRKDEYGDDNDNPVLP